MCGCARVICKEYHQFGNKSELHIGFRFPAYAKHSKLASPRHSKPKFAPNSKPIRIRQPSPDTQVRSLSPDLQSDSYSSRDLKFDLNSDLKSDSTSQSCLSISVCDSINVLQPTITTCISIDIMPCLTKLSLTPQPSCNIDPDFTAEPDSTPAASNPTLPASLSAPPANQRCIANKSHQRIQPPSRIPDEIYGVFRKCFSCGIYYGALRMTKYNACGSSNLSWGMHGGFTKTILNQYPFLSTEATSKLQISRTI